MTRQPSPVWAIYDSYRLARFRKKCFAAKYHEYERQDLALKIALAVFTPTSALASLAFLATGTGQVVWQTLLVIASIIAVATPFLKLSEKTAAASSKATQYALQEHDLESLKKKIELDQAYSDDVGKRYTQIMEEGRNIIGESVIQFSRKMRERFTKEVKEELPNSSFYVPE